MRVVFFGISDPAHLCHRTAAALEEHLDWEVLVCTVKPNKFFRETHHSRRISKHGRLPSADVYVSTGDGRSAVTCEMLPPNAAFISTHAGTAFRENHETLNRLDRVIGARARFVGADSLRFAKDAHVWFCPVEPDFAHDAKRTVAHSPSKRHMKGTELIQEVCPDLELIEGVSHEECVRRRRESIFFVDQLNAAVGGFGVSALEALASGAIVFADLRHVPAAEWRPPIVDVRTADELRACLQEVQSPDYPLHRLRLESVTWAAKYTSPEAVAHYWQRVIEGVL